jgi:predicted PurR-regulated permease PerM
MISKPLQSAWRLGVQGWLKLLVLGLVLWVLITYAGLLMEVLWVLFGALLLSLAIHPVVSTLARWRIPRGVTVLGVYVLFGVILALLGALVAPAVRTEIAALQSGGPGMVQSVISRIAQTPVLGKLVPSTDVVAQNLIQRMDVLVQTTVTTAESVGSMALDILFIFVLTFFVSTDAHLGERLLDGWLPGAHRTRIRHLWNRLRVRLIRWMWAQVGIAIYFAVAFSAGLALLGTPFAFIIGLVGGILEIVPYLGGAVALLLALASALTVRPILAVWVFVLYLVVTQLESHVIAPAFYGRVIGLHPAAVLVALLVGVKAGGVLGVLFAIPVAVVFAALIAEARIVWGTGPDEAKEEGDSSGEPVSKSPHSARLETEDKKAASDDERKT